MNLIITVDYPFVTYHVILRVINVSIEQDNVKIFGKKMLAPPSGVGTLPLGNLGSDTACYAAFCCALSE